MHLHLSQITLARSSDKYGERGSVSVYLALCFVLIVSLIFGFLEAGRSAAARVYAEICLTAAAESVLGEYYAPLMENYGLFALDTGFGKKKQSLKKLDSLLEKYKSDLPMGLECSSIGTVDTSPFLDASAEHFILQAADCVNDEGAMQLLEMVMEAAGICSEEKESSELISEKISLEDELEVMDRYTLSLAEILGSGSFRGAGSYTAAYLEKAEKGAEAAEEAAEAAEETEEKDAEAAEETAEAAEKAAKEAAAEEVKEIRSYLESVSSNIDSALNITGEAIQTREKLAPKVAAFEQNVEAAATVLGESRLESIRDSLSYMKAYVGLESDDNKVPDFDRIKAALTFDRQLLYGILGSELWQADDPEGLAALLGGLQAFSYDGMDIIFSTAADNTLGADIIQTFRNSLSGSFLDLLLQGSGQISENCIETDLLPSISRGQSGEQAEGLPDLSSFLKMLLDDPGTAMESASAQDGLYSLPQLVSAGAEALENKAYLIQYFSTHFSCFTAQEGSNGKVMAYELEYLLTGNESDDVNLAAAAARIYGVRLLSTLMYTFTDRTATSTAEGIAEAAVGVLGLHFLTAAVKYAILLAWAAEQAAVETSAILRGKSVPMITNDESFCIGAGELLTFSGQLVREKAEAFTEDRLAPSYKDYLILFLFLKDKSQTSFFALDLIQENIRYEYDEDFLLQNCIDGLTVHGSFRADPIWINGNERLTGKIFRGFTLEKELYFCY